MSIKDMEAFRHYLPPELIERSKSLVSLGFHEYAWYYIAALEVIDILVKAKIIILGGDVYIYENNVLKTIWDDWYFNPSELKPKEEEINNSGKKARDYIQSYVKRNGEQYLFSIVALFP